MKKTLATLALLGALCLICVPGASATTSYKFGDAFSFAPATDPESGTTAPAFTENLTVPAGPDQRTWWAGVCDLHSGGAAVGSPPVDRRFPNCIDQPASKAGPGFSLSPEVLMTPLAPGVRPIMTGLGSGANGWKLANNFAPATGPSWRLEDVTQAGARADASGSFWFSRGAAIPAGLALFLPLGSDGQVRDLVGSIPPGVAGNPNAVPQCPSADLRSSPVTCDPRTQIGVSEVTLGGNTAVYPVYNVEPRDGKTAEFIISGIGLSQVYDANAPVTATVRTEGDFGVDAVAADIPSAAPVTAQTLTFWGVPWAASHDKYRPVAGYCGTPKVEPFNAEQAGTAAMQVSGLAGGVANGCSQEPQHYDPSWGPIEPFIATQTECSATNPVTRILATNWQTNVTDTRDSVAPLITGCEDLTFPASIGLAPTTAQADSPSGLDVSLDIPQNNEPPAAVATDPNDDTGAPAYWTSKAGLATAQLKDTEVTLPEGFSINPAAAAGQAVCTTKQIGLLPPALTSETQTISASANEVQTIAFGAASGGSAMLTMQSATGSATTTSGSPTLTEVRTTTGAFKAGAKISGTGIPAGATILSVGVNSLTISANATASNSGVTLTATETTAPIAYNATAGTVETALVGLGAIEPADVAVSGPDGGPWSVEFKGALAGRDVPTPTFDVSSLNGGSATVSTVAPEGGDEVQEVSVVAGAGTFTLTFSGQTTAGIAFGATAATVQAALEALSNVDPGDAIVTGPAGGPWKVRFDGGFAGVNVAQMTADGSSLKAKATVTSATSTFTLTLNGETTAPVPYSATREEIRAALVALPDVGDGDISFVAGPGGSTPASGPWTVHFAGNLAGVNLPQMVAANANLSGGLQTVAVATEEEGGVQFGPLIRFNNDPPDDGLGEDCPEASKIATAVVDTPLLKEADWPRGDVYLAAQGDNPFHSNYAIYIALRSPERGLVVKLAGKVEPDPVTGRIKTTVLNNPQVPFEHFQLHFKGGPQAPLATSPICGTFQNHSLLTSYADPENPKTIDEDVTINQDPNGGTCATSLASRPLKVGFDAGSTGLVAGAHSPFTVRLQRPDGNQEFDRVEVTTPEGLVAKLAGVPYCPESGIQRAIGRTAIGDGKLERSDSSCPAASKVGTTTIGAGAGRSPFFVKGNVYLAGPYKGAPVSLAFIVPAVAGPFDLGVQVVRTALNVNPATTQVTAVSDTIPKILAGVPLRIRDIRVDLDRPDFTINPTDCSEQQVTGKVFGASGAVTSISNRYQVAECGRLGFKPSLKLQLFGSPKRGKYQRLKATLTAREGDANIARASVGLPHSEFLAQEHIRTVCTRVQFAAEQCPAASIYGQATAISPLLDQPLSGPVYLRSSDNPLPDLVAALKGPDNQPIKVELVGRTDSFHGGIRNTFDVVPDAPVSKFTLEMQGGKKSLIVNSRNVCSGVQRATAQFDAQNGRTYDFRPAVTNSKCGKVNKRGKHRGHARRAAR